MNVNNTQPINKTLPEDVRGTIKISSGEVINIKQNSVQSNMSTKSSEAFVKELKKAIKEGVFKKEDEASKPTKSTAR